MNTFINPDTAFVNHHPNPGLSSLPHGLPERMFVAQDGHEFPHTYEPASSRNSAAWNGFSSLVISNARNFGPRETVFDDVILPDHQFDRTYTPSNDPSSWSSRAEIPPTFPTATYEHIGDAAWGYHQPTENCSHLNSSFPPISPTFSYYSNTIESHDDLTDPSVTREESVHIQTQQETQSQTHIPTQESVPVVPENLPRRRGRKRKICTEEEKIRKRTQFLERNRLAAARCRSRKKSQADCLKEALMVERERNARIREELGELTMELGKFRQVYAKYETE